MFLLWIDSSRILNCDTFPAAPSIINEGPLIMCLCIDNDWEEIKNGTEQFLQYESELIEGSTEKVTKTILK